MDGLPFASVGLILSAITGIFLNPWIALPFALFAGFTLWFFRDPERSISTDPRAIVSPADGRILEVRRVPYPRILSGEAQRVSIFMSPLNVHVNRIPFAGTVRHVEYNPGKFLAAYAEKASLENEQTAVVIETERGDSLMFVQIAGMIARRIICRVQTGERVSRGERYGLIRFGSRCDFYLPDNVDVLVKAGDRVAGARTVIGVFR